MFVALVFAIGNNKFYMCIFSSFPPPQKKILWVVHGHERLVRELRAVQTPVPGYLSLLLLGLFPWLSIRTLVGSVARSGDTVTINWAVNKLSYFAALLGPL